MPPRLLQGSLRVVASDSGQLLHDARGAIAQLGVRCGHVHHQVAGHLAETHHGEGGEQVQDQFRGRAGFEARRAGQDLRAHIGGDDHVRPAVAGDFQARIETEQDGGRSAPAGFVQGAPYERRAAAGDLGGLIQALELRAARGHHPSGALSRAIDALSCAVYRDGKTEAETRQLWQSVCQNLRQGRPGLRGMKKHRDRSSLALLNPF